MLCCAQRLVKDKYHCGQDGNAADHAEDDSLCHYYAEVAPEGEGHKAESRKARDRCDRAADDRGERFVYRSRHCLISVFGMFTLLVVAVPEEYGIVHRYGKLEHRGQRFCYIGDLAEEIVRSEVEKYHHAD